MTTLLRMPITNVFGQGDYSVTLHLGSEKSPVNLLLDTGSSTLVVKNYSDQAALDTNLTTSAIDSKFAQLLAPFKEMSAQLTGIDAREVDLSKWPTLYFTFVSEPATANTSELIEVLPCPPHMYWQINTPNYGKACFRLLSQLPQWPNQSIIGLPLLNNYYVVFDRSAEETGVVKFAQQR